jgi:hypothetical protein
MEKVVAAVAGLVMFISWAGLEGGAFSPVEAGMVSMLAAPVFVNALEKLGAFND